MLRLLFSLFVIFPLLSSCASLPEYAQPRVSIGEDVDTWNELIRYRQLGITDFRSPSLSGDLRKHSYKLQAHTKIIVRAGEETKYSIYRTQAFNRIVYRGGIEKLVFEALMIPDASWWSPRISSEKAPYVLQHEQIHFAIMEVTARKMNRQVQEDESFATCYGESREEVEKLLADQVSNFIEKNLSLVVAEHTTFDEDTSLRYDPKMQQQWYEKITEQLKVN